MEPILDETSLVPCPVRPVAARILEFAQTLRVLDNLGVRRVLRSVRDAADRDIGGGLGLRSWCFDRSTDRDAGRLIARRLDAQPYIDGPTGLYAAAEGNRIVEATVDGMPALGAGLAALTDSVLVILVREASSAGKLLTVVLTHLDEDGLSSEQIEVQSLGTSNDVARYQASITKRIDRAVPNGRVLLERLGEMFPRLRLGERARDQIESLSGNEPVFQQLLRHLRALDESALHWAEGRPFEPVGVTYSSESQPTLDDGNFGPMRDFPTPAGFEPERWRLHTKLTGGAGARLYYRAVRAEGKAVVLIGYFGDHLPTVKYRT